MTIKQKVIKAIQELERRTIEREELIRLVIVAIFSKKHMFLYGERGVGKSYIIRLLGNLIEQSKYWELQVGIDTEAKQLFGVKKVSENGTIYYDANNTILDAHLAFLDEMFKAKSEVLNTLLQVMVDRYYTTGDSRMIPVPLISMIGASNEYPSGSLAAPYLDRLTLWYDVTRITEKENRLRFFNGDFDKSLIQEPLFTLDDIETVYKASKNVIVPREILETFTKIVDQYILRGVKTSDRKYAHLIEVMKVSAVINERDQIDYSELFYFLYGAWHNDVEKRMVEEDLYNILFSNKENIDAILEKVEKAIEKWDSIKNGQLFDFLNYKAEFYTQDSQQEFEKLIGYVNSLLQRYYEEFNELVAIKERKAFVDMVERQIENNMLLPNFKNRTFNEENLNKLLSLETELENRIAKTSEWLKENQTLIDYKRNQHSAGSM